MVPLYVSMLGGFHVEWKGKPLTDFESNKVRALLAYLVVEADRSHQRSHLAALLWPDHPERMARTNLRHVLRSLRQSLPNTEDSLPLLLATQQTLQLNPDSAFCVDVARFSELLEACQACDHSALTACADCMERCTEAAALYRGEFLAGLTLRDSDLFEGWALTQQERLHRQAMALFFTLAAHHEAQGDYKQASHYAWRQIELEPWREEAHRQLMWAQARSGQRTAALAQYEACRAILMEELDVEPDAKTVALYKQIWRGHPEGPAAAHASAVAPAQDSPDPSASQDWGEAPRLAYFYGRQTEMEVLQRWLIEDNCPLIAVLGMGGMGKTSLVFKVANELSEAFDVIFWRSLLNAPPLSELLHPLLQLLLPSGEVQLPTTQDEQLALLAAQLSARRCLVVLDNLESILEPGEAGRYRPGYEAYGQLLRRFGHGAHQSCLIFTSRERPKGVEQMADDLPTVRSLGLSGLEPEAGWALLKTRGLRDEPAQATRLVERYSGNPLALKIVTRTIQELFEGDITAFLRDETLIFDDIRAVLDEQFTRLTPLERELLIWLAVERETVPLDELAQNLVHAPLRRDLIEALRALQRRSLLERSGSGFTLPNVVIEYLTDYLIEQVCQEIEFPIHPFTDLLLNRHALCKAQAKEYVRQSQLRQIVQPIAGHLLAKFGRHALVAQLERMLAELQALAAGHAANAPGYLGGNLLNLLLHLDIDLTGRDFSHLCLWQAYLRGVVLSDLNLTGADLAGAAFTYSLGTVVQLQYRADGELLLAGAIGDVACIWRARDGTLLHAVPMETLAYTHFIRLPRDGHTAALAGANRVIFLVDMVAGQILHTLTDHGDFIWRLLFSPSGTWLASGDAGGKVFLWDVEKGERLLRLEGHTTPITALAFAPGAKGRPDLLASGSVDGTVSLWQLPSGRLLRTYQAHEDETAVLQFVLGGEVLATGSHDRTICLWDVATGALRHRLQGHTQFVRMMETDAGGQTLVTGGGDHFIAVWDPATGQMRRRLADHAAPLWQLAGRQDGQQVAALDANVVVGTWDLHTAQRIQVFPIYRNGIQAIAFSPDGQLLACGSVNGTVDLWDIGTPAAASIYARLHGHTRQIRSLAFSVDGVTFASGSIGGELRVWSISDGGSRILSNEQRGIIALAFSPDGQLLASAGADGSIGLWHVPSGQCRHYLCGHTNDVTACDFSPDGRWLVSCGMDRTVRVWDVGEGTLIRVLHGHTNIVRDVRFCPDGQRIISTGFDQTTRLWDAAEGQLLACWSEPDVAYLSLSLHPGGALVAAGSQDRSVRLLELETGRLLGQVCGHDRPVEAVRFSPALVDGAQLLASASQDETIKLWTVESTHDTAGVTLGAACCVATLRAPGPYAGMRIGGVTGISPQQRLSLKALGAVVE